MNGATKPDAVTRRHEYMRAHGLDVFSSVRPEILAELDYLVLTPEEIEDALGVGRRDREAAERVMSVRRWR